MTNNMLHIGSVVLSVRGRDKGNYFTVIEQVGDVVYIADGDRHKLSSPKKKNIKHVRSCGEVLEGIADKLTENKKVFDSELRSALRCYNDTMQKTQ